MKRTRRDERTRALPHAIASEIDSIGSPPSRASNKGFLQLALRRERRKREGKGRLKRRSTKVGEDSKVLRRTNKNAEINKRHVNYPYEREETRKERDVAEPIDVIGKSRKAVGRARGAPKRRDPTNFELYLEQEGVELRNTGKDTELELQKSLEKKLGKRGRKGPADGLDDLLQGIVDTHEHQKDGQKRIPPGIPVHARALESSSEEISMLSEDETESGSEEGVSSAEFNSEDEGLASGPSRPRERKEAILGTENKKNEENHTKILRQVRSLLNKLAESNLRQTVEGLATLAYEEGRKRIYEVSANELLKALVEGPLASSLYTTVVACCVGGVAAFCKSSEFIAVFLSKIARRLEDLRKDTLDEDRSRKFHNLNLIVCKLYKVRAIDGGLLYGLLNEYKENFTDLDISSILQLLRECGTELRSADPAKMKSFVVNVHERAALARKEAELSKRAELMLETVCDVKNNKLSIPSAQISTVSPNLVKFVKSSRLEDFQVKCIPWAKLSSDKNVGLWWLPSTDEINEFDSTDLQTDEAGSHFVKSMGNDLLKLAARQRMNTDTRRAIFCIIMGAEDYIDAFEKLLRLSLKGAQEREIVRVLVDCCLHESSFNAFYGLLGNKLCSHSQSHRFTTQYCIWDHLKELDSMDLRKLGNLSQLISYLLLNGGLSLSLLRVLNWEDPFSMSEKTVLLLRMVLETVLVSGDVSSIKKLFGRLLGQAACASICSGIPTFIRLHMQRCLPGHPSGKDPEMLHSRKEMVRKLLSAQDELL